MKRKRRDPQKIRRFPSFKIPLFQRYPWARYPVYMVLGLALLATIGIVVLSQGLPSLSELESAGETLLVTRIYSADGKLLDQISKNRRIYVPIDRMPQHLLNATIASEDRKFLRHWGLDLKSIFKYTILNITHMEIMGGGSTLTQQLAKKIYLTPKQTLIRKMQEALTALQIERTYSKREILEMYLNRMTMGRGAFGVQAAALSWFGKNVEDLTVDESAMLVGLLQLPYGYYSPDRDSTAAARRRNVVMKTMVECGYLDQAAYDTLRLKPLKVIPKKSENKIIAPYFCEYVIRELEKKYGVRLWTDGLSIYTTLDTRIQACADSAVQAFIPKLEKTIHQRFKEKRTYLEWLDPPLESEKEIAAFVSDSAKVDSLLRARATLQSSLTAIDPTNGHILAMVGGCEWGEGPGQSKWNHATQMARQPGSCFKPIAYTVAIDNGYPSTSLYLNVPMPLPMPDGTYWNPGNYDGTTGGRITMLEGLYRSLNLVTVRMVHKLQIQRQIVKYAHNFGLTTEIHPYAATALGSDVVIPIEMVSAFSTFADQGVRMNPLAVLRVEDSNGNILEENTPNGNEVISAQTAYVMTSMMENVLDHDHGTGTAARWKYHFYRPAAGKTGTTNDFRNAWFIGFTPQIVAGVWVGFDDERISMGDKQSGSQTALPIWAPFMKMAYDSVGYPLVDFTEPPGIERHTICAETGQLAANSCPNKFVDVVFKAGTAPTDTCEVHGKGWEKKTTNKNRRVF